ncbi:sugar phosphate isomerase/epimerase family protein [Humisphaera borealis]|uniref:Sugar phosphate isomerase/epimerase n=1 Tax=Humisphaera borealis TaxID=2807512 RepID=A0A7M2X389_9BACT|nr:sugar phosphate isomerase/epimerase [Humisphaera borealis]QOV91230.1 sugar phosphate isomerase/epimerase [Humisphaera borealis]
MDPRNNSNIHDIISRRRFLGGVAALGATAMIGRQAWAADAAPAGGKPNSVFGGVAIGINTYSYRSSGIDTAEQTLKALIENGLSEVELKDGPIRAFGVLPPAVKKETKGDLLAPKPTPEELAKLRAGLLAKAAELRKLYNDAGVNIHIHKVPFGKSDDDINFNFEMAKALGCKAITTERSDTVAKALAPFAEKHKIYVAFHNHTNNIPTVDTLDPLLDYGKYIAFNFDIGHYVAGSKGKSPLAVIEKYHDRIVSLHLKDRTPDGGNVAWGQGKTPIKEVLQLLKKEKWPIHADIELEYKIPAGSTSVAEVGKCVAYCREALA